MARLVLCLVFFQVSLAGAQGLSDEEIYDRINEEVEAIYLDAVAEVDVRLQNAPGDVRLAAERCATMSAYAYSELLEIETAYEDAERCIEELREDFPGHPEAEIPYARDSYSENRTDNLRSLIRISRPAYNQAQHARLLVSLSESLRYGEDQEESDALCADALVLDLAAPCRLAAADHYARQGNLDEAVRVLTSPLGPETGPYQQVQKIQKLIELEQNEWAVRLYEELDVPELGDHLRIGLAESLAAAKLNDEAQEVLAEITDEYWSPAEVSRTRYRVAMTAGDYRDAKHHYDTMLEANGESDFLLRTRFELLRAAPGLGWTFNDLLGILILLLSLAAIVVLAMVPAAAVHYRGLVRRARGMLPGVQDRTWSLFDAFYAMVTMIISGLAVLYVYDYDYLNAILFDVYLSEAAANDVDSPFLLVVTTAVWALLLLPMMLRGNKLAALGTRNWSIGKCLGVGVGLAVVFRFLAVIPGMLSNSYPEIGEVMTTPETIYSMYESYGIWATLAVVAVAVPLVEEISFRGAMLHGFARHVSTLWANLLQAFIFAAIHESLIAFPFFVAIAYVASTLALRAGGLLPAIIFHAVFNTTAVLLFPVISGYV